MCAQRRLKSVCASAQSDQCPRCLHEDASHHWLSKVHPVKIPIRLHPSKHTASQERRYSVAATSRRCSDIVTTLMQRFVFAGTLLSAHVRSYVSWHGGSSIVYPTPKSCVLNFTPLQQGLYQAIFRKMCKSTFYYTSRNT